MTGGLVSGYSKRVYILRARSSVYMRAVVAEDCPPPPGLSGGVRASLVRKIAVAELFVNPAGMRTRNSPICGHDDARKSLRLGGWLCAGRYSLDTGRSVFPARKSRGRENMCAAKEGDEDRAYRCHTSSVLHHGHPL